jgi:tellurite resistance protein TerA
MPETALIVGEFYLRNGEWKFRAVGQGFVGGLGPLARQYGVDVADDPDVAAPPPAPPVARANARAAPSAALPPPHAAPAAPPSKPSGSGKITLEKKGNSISLEKKGQDFGEIVINLNWNQGSGGGGFFSRLTGGNRGVDLDLGCLFRLRDGRAGAVQALGDSFGSLQERLMSLMGDDRTGASTEGEFLHINGRQWNQVDRVLVFAFIYEGAPNWAETDAVVTLQTPDQPTLEIRIDSHHREHRMCALALLENQGGNIKVTKLAEYFRDHRLMDQAYGFGLRWVAGSKD